MENKKIQIKRIGYEMGGMLYQTKKGSYVIDVNFVQDNDVKRMYLHTCSYDYFEPCRPLKSDNFEVVDEFDED